MRTISIVGGGIAGLALAARLDPGRFDVTVHEQRAGLPPTGTVLGMWPAAQRALDAIGILDAVRAVSPAIPGLPVQDHHGHVWATPRVEGMVGVSRGDLLRLLDGAVPATVRRLTGRVDDVRDVRADLVVGADGVHSAVRRAAWGERAGARLTPYLAVRGVIGEPVWREGIGEYWGRGDLFGIGPSRTGTNWYASFRSDLGPADVDVAVALAVARERYADGAPAVRRVLAAATPETSLAQRIWTTPPLRRYVRGAVVLVGDSAHAMTPNLGRGACESLVDAVTLAELLNSRPPRAALAAYERRRLLRTQALRVASAAVMRLALAERGQPARDRALGLAGRLRPDAPVGAAVPHR
ncbi:FAD-dependent monooxygenase [Georgenia sp. EYE_87]|uniref:FAD-dependent monooxygenase n=1 Tax=Georgenia sp. EYE_87 TaxID=2853448 RepID=UPI0020052AEB|nr:FAD-dependent monooxygenase [Georgenia sp. EYE_87]MCK6210158.1 FAD-dependent monooxygenase [Georgenia sp. EYE_87]